MKARTHGHSSGKRTKEYIAWGHMKQRCNNPNHPAYKYYGGRGIKVCKSWLKYENFLADVGLATSSQHSLDRYPNNDGNYKPGNVRWATTKEQSVNKRTSKMVNGKSASVASKELGGSRLLIIKRLRKGWSFEKATTTPVNQNKNRYKNKLNENLFT